MTNRYVHLFETIAEFESAYTNDYIEPWVSYTIEGSGLTYNKKSEPPHDYSQDYLTFKITGDGNIVWRAQSSAYTTTISYSKDSGETWTDITSNTGDSAPSISVSAGDKVQFRGDNAAYSTPSWVANRFYNSTAKFELEGNIMSLIDSTGYTTATTLTSSYTFYALFRACTGLTSAENLILPATTLASYCYASMFYDCTNLITAPSILPATTLANSCYSNMFEGCTSLTTAPELPATTLADYCYYFMFDGCTSLTTAPELPATTLANRCYNNMFMGCTSLTTAPELPATTLANGCYCSMFSGCTSLSTGPSSIGTSATTSVPVSACSFMFYGCKSLVTGPSFIGSSATTMGASACSYMFYNCTALTAAPELPATTLRLSCYYYMFFNCKSLTTAPELPATTLQEKCYMWMFHNCTNLNYIKCLTTNISATNCTYNWVNGVASSGTFVKNPNMTSWPIGANGIPSGWTVEDAS